MKGHYVFWGFVLMLAACPLMHFFHRRGSHGGGKDSEAASKHSGGCH